MAGGLSQGTSLPPEYDYEALKTKYQRFKLPEAVVLLGGEVLQSKSEAVLITSVEVELSSGYEASVAKIRVSNVYNVSNGTFATDRLGKQLTMGTTLAVSLGYAGERETVFVGFVAGLAFLYDGESPCIEITGMDIKGLMMAGNYAYQLSADNYADAVREILRKTAYEQLRSSGGITGIDVTDTPDVDTAVLAALKATETAQQAATEAKKMAQMAETAAATGGAEAIEKARLLKERALEAANAVKSAMEAFQTTKSALAKIKSTVEEATKELAKAPAAPVPIPIPPGPVSEWGIEMASESDYEFVVKAAKKFNFEFFVDRGTVYFRKAKSNPDPLLRLATSTGLATFRIEYSITGIVGSVEARAMDVGEGKIISAKGKLENDISDTQIAKSLVKSGRKVLIDPTIGTQAVADARAAALLEQMSYRLGMLEAECVGIPELLPGRFIQIKGLGAPADNDFYLTTVVHSFDSENGYRTTLVGKADKVKGANALESL